LTERVTGPLYHPGTLAAYCIISLPVGLCLYGLNVARRGDPLFGRLFAAFAVFVFVAIAWAGAMGKSVSGIGFFGVALGVGIAAKEHGPYQRAMRAGAVTARWWPPLVYSFGFLLIMIAILILVDP